MPKWVVDPNIKLISKVTCARRVGQNASTNVQVLAMTSEVVKIEPGGDSLVEAKVVI